MSKRVIVVPSAFKIILVIACVLMMYNSFSKDYDYFKLFLMANAVANYRNILAFFYDFFDEEIVLSSVISNSSVGITSTRFEDNHRFDQDHVGIGDENFSTDIYKVMDQTTIDRIKKSMAPAATIAAANTPTVRYVEPVEITNDTVLEEQFGSKYLPTPTQTVSPVWDIHARMNPAYQEDRLSKRVKVDAAPHETSYNDMSQKDKYDNMVADHIYKLAFAEFPGHLMGMNSIKNEELGRSTDEIQSLLGIDARRTLRNNPTHPTY